MLRGLPREQTAVTVLSLICCAVLVVLLLLLSYPLTSDCVQYKANMGLADVVLSSGTVFRCISHVREDLPSNIHH